MANAALKVAIVKKGKIANVSIETSVPHFYKSHYKDHMDINST